MSAVRFDGVTLDYGRRRVLEGVSFDLERGSFTGVLGPNGAGKSTVMRAILGLVTPSAGTISVLGRAAARGGRTIGYMPQQRRGNAEIRLSAREYLVAAAAGTDWGLPFASASRRGDVDAALKAVGAEALARRPLSDLSGGERQRIYIAQALTGDPDILVLDEPLSGLDPAHQRSIVELVGRISRERNVAVLFSAHEINPLLPAVDQVLYLGGGRAAVGSVDAVINGPVLSALYGTPVHVARAKGRIFVLAEDCELESHPHDHHGHVEAAGPHAR